MADFSERGDRIVSLWSGSGRKIQVYNFFLGARHMLFRLALLGGGLVFRQCCVTDDPHKIIPVQVSLYSSLELADWTGTENPVTFTASGRQWCTLPAQKFNKIQ